MTSHVKIGWAPLALALGLVLLPGWLLADKPQKPAPAGETVEMFSAIKDGQIEVQLIPKDSTQCRVLVKNKTDKPLSVKLPEVFAGVPVLAQGAIANPAGGGMGGRGNRGMGGMGGGQGFGGGMGGMGMGGMGGMMGGMGGGMFNVAPEKVGQFKVTTVCLDHGKAEPKPNMKYEIKPLEEYTDKAGVREILSMLGQGAVQQRVAQVATWHFNNNMSWQQLAAKELKFADGRRQSYFSAQELQAAMQVAVKAANLAEQHKKAAPQPVSASASLSQK